MKTAEKKMPRPEDVAVGARLRQVRTLAGMSQERLGDAVNLSFQQIQKYEKGQNRIGASRLTQFSRILNVSPSYFFEDIVDGSVVANTPQPTRLELELIKEFRRIPDRALQHKLVEMVRAMAISFNPEELAADALPVDGMVEAATA